MKDELTPDPRGRLDVLLLRLGEAVARTVERKLNVSLWDGEDGLEGVLQDKLRELKIPDAPVDLARPVSVRSVAEQAGFIRHRRRIHKAQR